LTKILSNKKKTVLLALMFSVVFTATITAFSFTANAASAWVTWTAYSAGDLVSYNGTEYKCLQSHTSLPGWEPSVVPALWQATGGGDGSYDDGGYDDGGYDDGGYDDGGYDDGGYDDATASKPGEVPNDIWNYTVNVSNKLGKDTDFALLLCAIIKKESAFGAALDGGSPSSGDGLMQVEPNTRSAYTSQFSSKFGHAYDHGNYEDQIGLGAIIIDEMISQFGSYYDGLLHYNGGPNWYPGATDSYGRPILAEEYAEQVMGTYKSYGGING
jgi:hypothetical protein